MGGNIIVTWLPPYPTENILVRNYAIEVYNNRTIRQKMLVGYKESSVIIYEAGILPCRIMRYIRILLAMHASSSY